MKDQSDNPNHPATKPCPNCGHKGFLCNCASKPKK